MYSNTINFYARYDSEGNYNPARVSIPKKRRTRKKVQLVASSNPDKAYGGNKEFKDLITCQ